jgi:hypothetical protein
VTADPENPQPFELDYDITVVDGEQGRRLAALQADAILDVLTWFHQHARPSDRLRPIKAEIRGLLGYPHPARVPAGVYAQMAIGISLDLCRRSVGCPRSMNSLLARPPCRGPPQGRAPPTRRPAISSCVPPGGRSDSEMLLDNSMALPICCAVAIGFR